LGENLEITIILVDNLKVGVSSIDLIFERFRERYGSGWENLAQNIIYISRKLLLGKWNANYVRPPLPKYVLLFVQGFQSCPLPSPRRLSPSKCFENVGTCRFGRPVLD
jgi:hypothetical protein